MSLCCLSGSSVRVAAPFCSLRVVTQPVASLCRYWSVTTISTVGYGDIAPTRYRPLFACFFIVAVVLFAFLLAESIALVTELGNYRRLAALFENGLSREALEKMDNYQSDGQVRFLYVTLSLSSFWNILSRFLLNAVISTLRPYPLVFSRCGMKFCLLGCTCKTLMHRVKYIEKNYRKHIFECTRTTASSAANPEVW